MQFDPGAEPPEKLIKYLGLGQDAFSIGKIPFLWQDALSLVQVRIFEKKMTIDKFFHAFHPHAGESHSVDRLLRDCQAVHLMVVTLGTKLERQSKKYRLENQLFCGYILDRMGSYLVEANMAHLDQKITREYGAKKQGCTIRYSPGYQDFGLECQSIFVDIVQGELPFLKILPNFQILPEKTITAIKGIKA
ncbi:MAG: hypothetical protein KKC20_11950 [Proteobacteria bacterium]|nr:hypothetical protein [Pseudomonadota bacterium]